MHGFFPVQRRYLPLLSKSVLHLGAAKSPVSTHVRSSNNVTSQEGPKVIPLANGHALAPENRIRRLQMEVEVGNAVSKDRSLAGALEGRGTHYPVNVCQHSHRM